jgi:hypothetical protein
MGNKLVGRRGGEKWFLLGKKRGG